MSKSKTHQIQLTLEDILEVHLELEGRELKNFSIQYKAFIKGKWRAVIRYDTAHGHLHVHRGWRGGEIEPLPQLQGLPYKSSLPWVKDDLKKNWEKYRTLVEDTLGKEVDD